MKLVNWLTQFTFFISHLRCYCHCCFGRTKTSLRSKKNHKNHYLVDCTDFAVCGLCALLESRQLGWQIGPRNIQRTVNPFRSKSHKMSRTQFRALNWYKTVIKLWHNRLHALDNFIYVNHKKVTLETFARSCTVWLQITWPNSSWLVLVFAVGNWVLVSHQRRGIGFRRCRPKRINFQRHYRKMQHKMYKLLDDLHGNISCNVNVRPNNGIWRHTAEDTSNISKANRENECARCVAYVPRWIWSRGIICDHTVCAYTVLMSDLLAQHHSGVPQNWRVFVLSVETLWKTISYFFGYSSFWFKRQSISRVAQDKEQRTRNRSL